MKGISRRNFLQVTAATGILAGTGLLRPTRVYAFSQSPILQKFKFNLPGLGPSGIPLATKGNMTFHGISTDVYNLEAAEYSQQIPGLAHKTTFLGYADAVNPNHRYLGGVVVATRNMPVLFKMTNKLIDHQIIPIDPTIMASETQTVGQLPLNRIAVHLHGGLTSWFSDGTPFQWFDPNGLTGPSFMNVPGTHPSNGTATYYYQNKQSARLGTMITPWGSPAPMRIAGSPRRT